MDRRAAGGVVLLLAVVCLLVVPRLTAPGVTGAAMIDPGPPPLPVGTCIADPFDAGITDGGSMGAPPTARTVPCTEPHWGEVALLDLSAGTDTQPLSCRGGRIASYLTGPAPAASTAAVRIDATAVGPDPQQYAGGQRWTSCVVHSDAPLVVPLGGIALDENPPPGLGRCYQDGFNSFDSLLAACTDPHASELLRYLSIDLDRQPSVDEVERWCESAISAAVGRSELSGLTVVTDVFAWFEDRQSRFVDLPVPAGALGATALCGLRVDGDRLLSSSLRQLGSADVPWVG